MTLAFFMLFQCAANVFAILWMRDAMRELGRQRERLELLEAALSGEDPPHADPLQGFGGGGNS